jgi:hypothetical protein
LDNDLSMAESNTINPDLWVPLGEQRWRELADVTGASELQLKFAAARFAGASATRAAKLAGYSGDSASLRRAGYAALRSTAVQNLLELAAINAPGDAKISDKEIDSKIAKLIRSPDSNVSLKAIEAFQKRESAKKEAEESGDNESLENLARQHMSVCRPSKVPLIWAEIILRIWHWHAPFITEFVPYLAKHHPDDWQVYRAFLAGEYNQMAADCDRLERGPLLTLDEILAKVGVGPAALDAPKKQSRIEESHVAQ